ncbi:MAG: DUF1003 domain-containing protein [Armatimonadetes bacterium]|nr:DUF1003 domain-containing protein [Armatimonadota bacterium]
MAERRARGLKSFFVRPHQRAAPPPAEGANTEPGDLVSQNIDAIAQLHAHAERRVSRYQRAIEAATAFLGRPLFLYLILAFVTLWIGGNLLAPRLGWPQWDPPPFSWLQGAVTLAALLMTTVILITQNRQNKIEERRAQLDLQVSLLAEQKVAKLIALVEELRRDLPNVHDRHDPEAEAMTEAADPHAVLSALEETLEKVEEEVHELEEVIEEQEEGLP